MKTYKTTHKCVEHVESAVLHILAWCIIALFMKTIYNVDREIPKSQVNPRHDHSGIEESLNKEWGDINCHLEEGHGKVGDVVQDHDGRANR